MKASVMYSKKEVCAMVLAQHVQTFPAPAGMTWTAKMDYSDSVTCELVGNEAEDGEKP